MLFQAPRDRELQYVAHMSRFVLGWDIGGVNTKVARVSDGRILSACVRAYEIQRDPHALTPLLRDLSQEVGGTGDDVHAVTMTAELSQIFRTKREGVAFVVDAVTAAFPSADVQVYTVDGRFLLSADAKREPLAVAASNWSATANVVALSHADAILFDIGTTTTDIIPIENGIVVAAGKTDPERLASGELVYTGTLRTPVEAITQQVPLGSARAGVSAEAFALIGDVHLWRGDLAPDDYSITPPDGRPASREFTRERIARIVCADREMLDDGAIDTIADAVANAQLEQIASALARVRNAHPAIATAVVTGLGAFIAERAARQAGLSVVRLAHAIGDDASRCAPAAAVALLLERQRSSGSRQRTGRPPDLVRSVVERVVKVGGSLLASEELLDATLETIVRSAGHRRTVIVPGGGPFADVVRDADHRLRLDDHAAHWMAILAMDQCAHLLAARRPELALVTSLGDVSELLASGRVPVLAPFQLVRQRDPLPHSWDVTSDSIAAWIASELGAQLVLVKHPGANVDDAVDAYFLRALPASLRYSIVVAPHLDLELSNTLTRDAP
jgi:probable H4MPT-linked C1 transfer pathway protein